MLSFLLFISLVLGRTAEIQTCSGCKLNRLPDVRKFIKEEVTIYPAITVRYINGHNPDLVVLDDNGQESERINLTAFDLPGLHALVKSRGLDYTNQEL